VRIARGPKSPTIQQAHFALTNVQEAFMSDGTKLGPDASGVSIIAKKDRRAPAEEPKHPDDPPPRSPRRVSWNLTADYPAKPSNPSEV